MIDTATLDSLWSDLDRYPDQPGRLSILADALEDAHRWDEAQAVRWACEKGKRPQVDWLKHEPGRMDWFAESDTAPSFAKVSKKLFYALVKSRPAIGIYYSRSAAYRDLARAWAKLVADGTDPLTGRVFATPPLPPGAASG